MPVSKILEYICKWCENNPNLKEVNMPPAWPNMYARCRGTDHYVQDHLDDLKVMNRCSCPSCREFRDRTRGRLSMRKETFLSYLGWHKHCMSNPDPHLTMQEWQKTRKKEKAMPHRNEDVVMCSVKKIITMEECDCPSCHLFRELRKNTNKISEEGFTELWKWHEYNTTESAQKEQDQAQSLILEGFTFDKGIYNTEKHTLTVVAAEDVEKRIMDKVQGLMSPLLTARPAKPNRFVFLTTQFVAFHNWVTAPGTFYHLRNMHRHVFHVKMWFAVGHDNRQIEFCHKKEDVDKWIAANYTGKKLVNKSCEMMAEELAKQFDASTVEVSEDGENGALFIPR